LLDNYAEMAQNWDKYNSGLEVIPNLSSPLGPTAPEPAYHAAYQVAAPPNLARKRRWPWLILLGLLIVAAVVGGAVGGVLRKKHKLSPSDKGCVPAIGSFDRVIRIAVLLMQQFDR